MNLLGELEFLDFDVVVNELVDVKDDRGLLDVHEDKGGRREEGLEGWGLRGIWALLILFLSW